MNDKNRTIDPMPDEFATEEEARTFWDSHSFTDYLALSTLVDVTVQFTGKCE